MLNKFVLFLAMSSILFTACGGETTTTTTNDTPNILDEDPSLKSIPVKLLSDTEYPDNPDMGFRSVRYNNVIYDQLELKRKTDFVYDFKFVNKTDAGQSISFSDINVFEFIPSVPEWVKVDEYLTYIGIINQEWNRMQLRFSADQYKIEGDSLGENVERIDIARNCLNSYLWEIIAFEKTEEGVVPHYHGWFDFPRDWYADMFNKKNDLDFEKYRKPLEDWVEPKNKLANLEVLRQVEEEKELKFKVLNDELYPLEGARKKKKKNIIIPTTHNVIQDFLTDSTLYATFMPPGFYTRSEPRKTELSRFESLSLVKARKTINTNLDDKESTEFALQFESKNHNITELILSGVSLKKIPVLSNDQAHKGWKMPMGIANHSFYETYDQALAQPQMNSPFFSFLLDGRRKLVR